MVEDDGPFCVLEPAAGAGVTVTEKRPTLEPVLGPAVALVFVDTWKRPIVVVC